MKRKTKEVEVPEEPVETGLLCCHSIRVLHLLDEGRALLDEAYTRDLQQVSDLLESLRQNTTDMHLPSNVVVDPPRSKTKGRAKRKKNVTEGTKRKKSARACNGIRSDTYVPSPRLI